MTGLSCMEASRDEETRKALAAPQSKFLYAWHSGVSGVEIDWRSVGSLSGNPSTSVPWHQCIT